MAEWMEVMNQFNRMCWHYQRKSECPMGCPMNGVNISQCRKVAFEQPEVTEKTVMDWAEEHPEPVYPVWRDWLRDLYGNSNMTMTDILESPIDPEIAQRLNIVPRRKRNGKNQESQCHIR